MSQSNAIIAAVTTIGGIALAAAVSVALYFVFRKDAPKSGDDNSSPSGFDADVVPDLDNDNPTPGLSPKLNLKPIAPKIPQPKPGSQQQMIRFKDIKYKLGSYIAKNPIHNLNKRKRFNDSRHSTKNFDKLTQILNHNRNISTSILNNYEIYSLPSCPYHIEGDQRLTNAKPGYKGRKAGNVFVHCGVTTDESVLNKLHNPGYVVYHNFANAKDACGGCWNGAIAQEESLCYESPLALQLTYDPLYEQFYAVNNYLDIDQRVVWLPRVSFSGNIRGVLTIAAKDLRSCGGSPTAADIRDMDERLRGTLNILIKNNCDTFVTGAFGCGVFKWPPKIVAKIYKKLLFDEGYRHYFNNVLFNIKGYNSENYKEFLEVFHNATI